MVFLQDLVAQSAEFYSAKQRLDRLLTHCHSKIKELIQSMQQADFEDAGEIFTELFAIQQALSAAKHKYLPDLELSSFLNDFLYFFDRQDEYNKRYLYTHFQQSNDLPD